MKRFPCLVLLLVLSTFCPATGAEGAKKKQSEPSASPQLTTLRAANPSLLVSGRPGSRDVRFVSVRVSNIGPVEARDVQVFMEGRDGLAFPMRGPKRLSPRGAAVYSTTQRVPVGIGLKNHATARCSNCRR